MKRRDLVRKIEKNGSTLIRSGKRHDWYQWGFMGWKPVPR